MSGLDALLASLSPWTLVGGKGGVGKTTCAAALAVRSARDGVATLVLSTDPAGTLADVLGVPLDGEPRPVPWLPNLFAARVDAAAARAAFVDRWRSVLATIIDRGTYLDREDIDGLIDAALPGIDETMGVLALAGLADRHQWHRVLLDTAPTGHTLRLLELPDTFRALVDLLDTMQAKHRFMVSALLHRYRPDTADEFIDDLHAKVARLRALLTDPTRAGVVLVSRPEPVVIAETERYASALEALDIHVRAVVMNAVPAPAGETARTLGRSLRGVVPHAGFYSVRQLGVLSPGIEAIDHWSSHVRRARESRRAPTRDRTRDVPGQAARPGRDVGPSMGALPLALPALLALPPVLIVGGKGGVGKTSVSCAIALAAARAGSRTLLVSTDPAPSIADALDSPVTDAEEVVRDGFGLVARQIDAAAAFARWQVEYRSRVDAAFAALLGPAVDAAHDRAVARELLALAPPGIDELYALVWLGDALAERRFERIVIDPAPTGHLIRLLEMPALALDWSHRLLRLMLKYRELAGGGDTAAELLAFARRTRAVGALLRDASCAGVLVVALDEPIVRLESQRVVRRVRELGDHVPAIIWNRARRVPRPLPVATDIGQFVAAEVRPPPVRADRLLAWLEEWRTLERDG